MAMTYLLVLNELYDIYSNSLIGHTYFNPNIIGDEKLLNFGAKFQR